MPVQYFYGIGLRYALVEHANDPVLVLQKIGVTGIDKFRPVNGRDTIPGWPTPMDLVGRD